jgi:phosphoglycerol transferase MdoB-like AlkP superfamily enzyme
LNPVLAYSGSPWYKYAWCLHNVYNLQLLKDAYYERCVGNIPEKQRLFFAVALEVFSRGNDIFSANHNNSGTDRDSMKIKFEFKKKSTLILTAVMLAIAIILEVVSGYALWMLFAFVGIYYLVQSLQIQVTSHWIVPAIFTTAFLILGPVISTYEVQHLVIDQETYERTSKTVLHYNMLCCAVLYLVIFLICASLRFSFIIAHSFFIVLGLTDFFVYQFRQNEFSFSDLFAAGTGLSVSAGYKPQVPPKAAYVIFIAAIFFAFVWKLKFELRKKWIWRISAAAAAFLCSFYLMNKTENFETQTWEQKGSYQNGYVLNFVLQIRDTYFIDEPSGYSKSAVEKLQEQYEAEDTEAKQESYHEDVVDKDVQNPTVIVIMNESFADLRKVGEFSTNQDITPFFDSLSENTVKGYALSSVFGAKTPNSEWEYLTGNTMGFLPSGTVPYQQYMQKNPSSIVSDLNSIGYTTVAMHPYYSSGWSRNRVYPRLGFDEMSFMDDGSFDQTQVLREYITDQQLYDKLIERYEDREDGEKLFMFGVTMQNHGGYLEYYSNFQQDCYATDAPYYNDVSQYLSLIHKSDEALKNLITYFQEQEDPVEIVFFGDHLPSLNQSFYQMLNGKGLSNLTMDELEDLFSVPFFIWTNYDTTEETVDITSLNFLNVLTMERGNFDLSPYQMFRADLMDVIPAMNSRGYYSKTQGHFIHYEDASGEEAEWLKQYRILQYNSLFDKKNRNEYFFPYYEEDSG